MQGYLLIAGDAHSLEIHPGFRLPDGREIALCPADDGSALLTIGDRTEPIEISRDGERLWVHLHGRAHALVWRDAADHYAEEAGGAAEDHARAPMPGSVVKVAVAAGEAVTAGQALLVIESMKLETTIRAARDGVVEAVHVALGQSFERDAPLVSVAQEG